jgi:hypothetical protein
MRAGIGTIVTEAQHMPAESRMQLSCHRRGGVVSAGRRCADAGFRRMPGVPGRQPGKRPRSPPRTRSGRGDAARAPVRRHRPGGRVRPGRRLSPRPGGTAVRGQGRLTARWPTGEPPRVALRRLGGTVSVFRPLTDGRVI